MTSDWLQEHIPKLNSLNWLYQTICFCMGKRKQKLTYEEMYILLYGINRNKKIDEIDAKKVAMLKVIEIYKSLHNNNLPKGVKYDD